MQREESNPDRIKRIDKEIYQHFENMNSHDKQPEAGAAAEPTYAEKMKKLESELREQINEMSTEGRADFENEAQKYRNNHD